MKHISILGSTGSIGTQALEVIRLNPQKFNCVALSAGSNVELLINQAKEFKPKLVHIFDETKTEELNYELKDLEIKIVSGSEGAIEVATCSKADIVLAAIVGFAGLLPTIEAIKAGKDIALANKETLVVAGDYVMSLADRNKVNIIPVDSEHSAIFQTMVGEDYDTVRRLILTASGGPFRGFKEKELHKVTPESALKHPNWDMGSKITIDSATMMNKGLEVIEAHWLFKMPPFKIEVVVHPQSVIHSMVEFKDRSMKAQMGYPDMKVPIQYAFSYPKRIKNTLREFDFADYPVLNFEAPDRELFPALDLAFEAISRGGNTPCIINAANEVAVEAFLDHKIGFMDIADVVERAMEDVMPCVNPSIEDLIKTDNESRIKTLEIIQQIKK